MAAPQGKLSTAWAKIKNNRSESTTSLSYKTNSNNDEGEIDHKASTNYLRTRSTRMLAISG